MSSHTSGPGPLAPLADDFLDRWRRGERPSPDEYAARYPDFAEEIRDLFPVLLVMENLGGSLAGDALRSSPGSLDAPRRLGDYRILRQVGRGGMGVVYEAVQESLGRHVALKVLTPQLAQHGTYLERFKREAKAAARLHHTNIVPVFGVGECDGAHYYAMQFIHGQGLDRVLDDVRHFGTEPRGDLNATLPGPARSLITGTYERPVVAGDTAPQGPAPAARSQVFSQGKARYFQEVARLGAQAAEALAYAHAQGVLHRDIKPANLLLDTQGTLWVTDFGLAKADDSENLTQTGDLVGTLRYMAPERFDGHGDARSDVYSLGVTLYEMLTLRPAFDQSERGRIIGQVTSRDFPRPRRIDPDIPRDLETVVLKAMARDPADRYATAAELAEDLRRFLADRPIRARRHTMPERLWRWGRRNPVVAALTGAVAVSLLLGTVVAWALAVQAATKAQEARDNEAQAVREKAEAEAARREVQQNLYYTEMSLAGHSATAAAGMARINEIVDRWRPLGNEPDRRGWEWSYLRGLGHQGHTRLERHPSSLRAVSWRPDGRQLATGGVDGLVRVWDAATGRDRGVLRGCRDHVMALAWSPDGRRLAAADYRAALVHVWEADTGKEIAVLAGHRWNVRGVSWSPDGRRLASVGTDQLTIWDVEAGRQVATARLAHPGLMVRWAPDGRRVAVGGDNGYLILWEPERGQLTECKTGNTNWAHSLAWSPDGRYLAIGGDGPIRLWDVERGQFGAVFPDRTSSSFPVTWAPDGKSLAAACPDQAVRIWDVATQQERTALRGHTSPVLDVAWAPDGQHLASVGEDGVVRNWARGARGSDPVLRGHAGSIFSVRWAPDGQRLATAGNDRSAGVWDADTGQRLATLTGPKHEVRVVAWSPDGHRVAGACLDEYIYIWDWKSGKVLRTIRAPNPVVALSWAPDGRHIASSGWHLRVDVWDVEAGVPGVASLGGIPEGIGALAWGPDGEPLAGAVGDGTVRIFHRDGQGEPTILRGHTSGAVQVVWSRDGRRLASTSTDRTIRLWDVADGRTLLVLRGHNSTVTDVSWGPDDRQLASVSVDGTLKLWDASTGRETISLRGHAGEVLSVAWGPDGRRIATAGSDGTVRIWDATPGLLAERSPQLRPELDRRLAVGAPAVDDLRLRAEVRAGQGDWDGAAADMTEAARRQGFSAVPWFVAGWWVAGPFGDEPPGGLADTLDPLATRADGLRPWRRVLASADGCLTDRALNLRGGQGTIWALARVYALREQPIAARVGASAPVRLRHNGQPPSEVVSPRPEGTGLPLVLAPGWNTLLLETQGDGRKDLLALALSAEPADRLLALADQGRDGEAEALAVEAIAAHPDDVGLRLAAGRLYQRRVADLRKSGRSDEANQAERRGREQYERLLALCPGHAGYVSEYADYLTATHADDSWTILDPSSQESAGGATLTRQPDGSLIVSGPVPDTDTYTLQLPAGGRGLAALRLEAFPDRSLPQGGPGRAADGGFVLTNVQAEVLSGADTSQGTPLTFGNAWADYNGDLALIDRVIEPPAPVRGGWGIAPQMGRPHVAVLLLDRPRELPAGATLLVKLHFHDRQGTGASLGRFRLSIAATPEALSRERWRWALAGPNLPASTRLAAALWLRGEPAAARVVLDQATAAADRGHATDRFLRSVLLDDLGRPEEARQAWDEAQTWAEKHEAGHFAGEAALEALTRRLRFEPTNAALWRRRSRWCARAGRRFEAAADLTRSQALDAKRPLEADDLAALVYRGGIAARRGDWAAAAADFLPAATLPNASLQIRMIAIFLRQQTGDHNGARAARSALLKEAVSDGSPWVANDAAWAGVFAPTDPEDQERLVLLAERAVAHQASWDFVNTLGAALYRAGRHEEAVRQLRKSLRLASNEGTPVDWYFLAMANHHLGNAAEAAAWRDKAERWMERHVVRSPTPTSGPLFWYDLLEAQLLRREADELFRRGERAGN